MLPKSRRALTIQEIAALARSSLHGISQVVKDHVTKPTAMAQGRVAHLIEWKGWCKPIDTSASLEPDFHSYSDLTEGQQEARFAAGVAEQFAIAEAKLKAWSSVDGDESNDDESNDDEFLPAPPTQSTDVPSYRPYLKDLIHSQLCQHLGLSGLCSESGRVVEGGASGDTLCSSLCSLDEQHPLLLKDTRSTYHSTTAELAAKILSALQGGEELLLARLQRPCAGHHSPCVSMSYSDMYLSPGEKDHSPCKDYKRAVCQVEPEYEPRRRVSDVALSGVVSLDEEGERAGEPINQ